MSDFPVPATFDLMEGDFFSTATALLGISATAPASTAWPTANMAIFVPWRVARPVIVYKLTAGCGATVGGNFDMGIYDAHGNRKVSSGAQARTNSTEVVVDVTDTVIGPGLYYLAMSVNGTTNMVMITPTGTSPVPLQKARLFGTLEAATSYVLPATVTMVARTATTGVIPYLLANMRPY